MSSMLDQAIRIKKLANEYHRLCVESEKACEARGKLDAGSTRARVTSANAKWMRNAEARDRCFSELLEAMK